MSTWYSIVAALAAAAVTACGASEAPKAPSLGAPVVTDLNATRDESSSYPANDIEDDDGTKVDGDEPNSAPTPGPAPAPAPAPAQPPVAPEPPNVVAAAAIDDPDLFGYRTGSQIVLFSTTDVPRKLVVLHTESGIDVDPTKPKPPTALGQLTLEPGRLFSLTVTRPAAGCTGECRVQFKSGAKILGDMSLDAANVDDIKGRTFPGFFDRASTTMRFLPNSGAKTLRFRKSGASSLKAGAGPRLRLVQAITAKFAAVTTDGDFIEVKIESPADELKITLEALPLSPNLLDYFEVSVSTEVMSVSTYYLSSLPTTPRP